MIRGGRGNDTLDGGEGEDTIRADLDDDRIFGSSDADYINGGDGFDTVDYSRSPQGDRFSLYNGAEQRPAGTSSAGGVREPRPRPSAPHRSPRGRRKSRSFVRPGRRMRRSQVLAV